MEKASDDPNANNISVEELTKLLEPDVPKMLKEQANRKK
jgi:hypothetical protein